MEIEPTDDVYFTFEGRLASFQKTKKRGSTAKGARALNWPHKKIDPEQLARAGFFFQPWPENPDNVACYLCHKSMDGWEEGDDPLIEHLKHSTSCGWAICAAVESEVEGFAQAHPAEKDMVEARKATFAGRWPHDAKRGWKCKTKQPCQYADNGSDEHYNRSPHCPFFALSALPKPKASRAKTARGSKVSRLSTQSIATFTSEAPSLAETTFATAVGNDTVLSTTSTMATKKGRAPKAATTAKGKKSKAKKGEPAPEPEEQVPFEEVQLEADREVTPEAPPPKKATRGKKRGSEAVNDSILTVTSEVPARKKRATTTHGSVAVDSSVAEATDDSQMTDVPAPALKKRTTAKKGRASAAKSRKASQSKPLAVAESPAQEPPVMFPDDDEIERQLEADLERPLTDDDDITADSDSERRKAKAKSNQAKAAGQEKSADYAMFDPSPPEELQEAEVDAELEALRNEMEVEPVESQIPPGSYSDLDREPAVPEEPEQLTVPKKGRKAGTTKASKQTKTKKAKVVTAPVAEEPEPEPEHGSELEPEIEPHDIEAPGARNESIGSTDTVVKNTEVEIEEESDGRPSFHSAASRKSTTAEKLVEEPVVKKKPRGRPSKASLASQKSVEFVDVPIEAPEPIAEPTANIKKKLTKKAAPAPESAPEAASDEIEFLEPPSAAPQPAKRSRGRPSKASLGAQAPVESTKPADDPVVVVEAVQKPAKKGRGRPSKASTEALGEPAEADEPKVEHVAPVEAPAPAKRGRGRPSKAVQEASAAAAAAAAASSQPQPQPAEQAPKRGRGRPPKKSSIESKPEEVEAQLQQEAMDAEARQVHPSQDDDLEILEDEPDLPPTQEAVTLPSSPPGRQAAHPPSTPGLSATSARQAGLSPSQSPQSSDAENQPPSSRPTGSVTTQRVALAPMAATPTRLSPSKRNILSNLQSKTPWKAVDLDAVLESPLKGSAHPDENTVDRLLRKGGDLTAKEKGMTVEEWVHYNASLAEDMLKGQCEKMVSRFESEGGRAMNVLENIEVE
ncbi:uncharacterized protein J7T54_006871 [Emericellopsis cladophorae]|uniref:Chromosome segregation protein BIR1 n=1 Tax=Emericellopsis cladophorae TaxID=2686198 RepID=A0A9P9Y7Z6_9HYPO|nr:uncharacterized protein J7T54_006871 [Emericellopsis cladophorae]KAI6785229.1 hypothetical protein J7T54_006871 [Emericellopsis cladophorae]